MDTDRLIRALAEQQFGLMGRDQLLGAGITDKAIRHRLDRGAIERLRPNVYRLVGAGESWEQSVMGACIWAGDGSAASHRTAGALLRLPGFDAGPLDLSTPRNITAKDVCIYKVKPFRPADVTTVASMPVTSVCRTIVDLSAMTPQRQLEDAVDEAIRRRLCTLEELRGGLRWASRDRRRGTRLLRSVLGHTDGRVIATQSILESRLLRCLLKAGLPRPVPQFPIRHNGEFVARVDFAYPGARVAIEAESYRWHGGPHAHARDIDRYNRLRDIGWELVLVTWQEVSYRAREVAARVAQYVLPRLT